MVGTFFLIYTGTATAVAATLGRQTGGSPPDSLAIALAFGFVLASARSPAPGSPGGQSGFDPHGRGQALH
jgi:glycerol uptake facilitator-like aquaporin